MHGSAAPQEIFDKICGYVMRDYFDDSRYFLSLPVQQPHPDQTRDLANLRLASKVTHKSASPLFFRHMNATFTSRTDDTATDWEKRLLDFARSPYVVHVHSLELGFQDGFSSKVVDPQAFLVACPYTIPTLARACTRLRTIKFRVGSENMGFDCGGNPDWSRCLLLTTISNALRECSATLESLDLSLPLAWDFGALALSFSTEPELLNLMSRISGLSLTILDDSGQGGNRYRPVLESENQMNRPNAQHGTEFWGFASLAASLKAFHVQCTHVLDANEFLAGNLLHLQELSLTAVEVSCCQLKALAYNNIRNIKAIEFWRTELTSGTWADVLSSLCNLPDLICFHMHSCGYSATGESSQNCLGLWPEPDDPQAIETRNIEEDYPALGALQRHVNAVRAAHGFDKYTDYDFRYMHLS